MNDFVVTGVSAYVTDVQQRVGIKDTRELFYQDTIATARTMRIWSVSVSEAQVTQQY